MPSRSKFWILLLLSVTSLLPAQTLDRGPTTEQRRLLVLLLRFSDSPAAHPFTRAQFAQFLFSGPLQSYFNEVSYGKLTLTGDVLDWTPLGRSAFVNGVCAAPASGQAEIDTALARPGVNPNSYDQIIFVVEHPCLGIDGAAGSIALPGKTTRTPMVWWNASPDLAVTTPGSAFLILAHETGHTLGADHARNWTCEESILYGHCTEVEYGNPFDMMATATFGLHFGAFYKELWGWLDAQSILTIDRSGRYTVKPLASSTGFRAARIQPPGYTRAPYYLEQRVASGLDQALELSSLRSNTLGLLVNQVLRGGISSNATEFGYPRLLDMRPGVPALDGTDIQQASLNVGQPGFVDAARGITIGPVISADANGVTFDVTIVPGQCLQPPSIGRVLRTSAALGDAGFDLLVDGSDFTASTAVRWNGSERPTTLQTSNRLRAQIPATDLTVAGSHVVSVAERGTGCAGSGGVFFDVLSVPTLTSLTPNTITAGSTDTQITLTGTGFTSISVARWNGAPLSTRYVDATKLVATVPASFLRNPFSPAITVSTAGTGGGVSNPVSFTIAAAPLPTYTRAGLVGIFYTAANAGPTCTNTGRGAVMSLYGQNLASSTQFASSAPWPVTLGGTSVLINGAAVPIQAATPGQINFQIPLELTGNFSLQVRSTSAGGALLLGPSITITIVPSAPCFLAGASGLIAVDPSGRVVDASNPLPSGGAFLLYGAGLGQTTPALASGQPAPSSNLAVTNLALTITIDGQPATVDYQGLTPGFVGLFQINSSVPAGGSTGAVRELLGIVRVNAQEFRVPLFVR